MTEESKEKEDYQFINEKIVPKRKNKILKRLGTMAFVICMAVVFGIVAQIVMLTSEDVLREMLGMEEGERQPVDLNRPSPSPKPSLTPTEKPTPTNKPTPEPTATPSPTPEATETPEPTMEATATMTPEPTVEATATMTPEPTAEATATTAPEPTTEPETTPVPTVGADATPHPTEALPEPTKTGEVTGMPTEAPEITEVPEVTKAPEAEPGFSYLQLYQEILKVADEVSSSLVVVEAIEEGVDWFQETYVTRTRTTGLVLANDGIDLLILVDIERISGATYIEVYFGDEVVSGRIYSMDKSYGLAVIAVPLNAISTDTLKNIAIGVLGEKEDIKVGTPVIALGAPNGYEGSMEFGMITSLGSAIAVTDGQVSYFTTDINDQANGYGFVVNLDGEIMGMITHTHKENVNDGIFSVVSLDEIRGVIVKLLNNAEQAYFGIKGQDLPRSVKENSGLESGVYVSEVENSSPALNAGIKAGDIIVAIGNEPVSGIHEFNEVLLNRSVREIVVVKLMRRAEDGMREMTVEVPLAVKN